jgi:hypothetical protein
MKPHITYPKALPIEILAALLNFRKFGNAPLGSQQNSDVHEQSFTKPKKV